jgi:hypothetical protein
MLLSIGIGLIVSGWLLTALSRSWKKTADIVEAYEAEIDEVFSEGYAMGWRAAKDSIESNRKEAC